MALQEIGIMDLLFGRIRVFQKKNSDNDRKI